MNRSSMLIALSIAALLVTPVCNAQKNDGGWEHRLTPYLWLPTIDGKLKYGLPPGGGGAPTIEVGPTDWLDLLNFGLLINGSSRKGQWSINYDLVYLSMTSKNDGRVVSVERDVSGPGGRVTIPVDANLNVNTRTDLDGLVANLTAGYAYSSNDTATHQVYAGARFFGVEVSTSWDLNADITVPGGGGVVLPSQGSVGVDKDLLDAIIGVRGRFELGNGNWSAPYAFDIGSGSSDLTWNALIGLEYQYGWGDLVFAYRHLAYDQDSDSLLQSFSFSGPAIGASFRF